MKEKVSEIWLSGMRDRFWREVMEMKKDGREFGREMGDDLGEKMEKWVVCLSMEEVMNGELKKV